MVQSEPVVREQLPTVDEAVALAAQAQVDELLQLLMGKGMYAAAHEVSMWFWGYGLEDTDNRYILQHMTQQAYVARNVAFREPSAVAARAAEYDRIRAERDASFDRAYPEGVRNIRLDGSLM